VKKTTTTKKVMLKIERDTVRTLQSRYRDDAASGTRVSTTLTNIFHCCA
jgi:hypothetical protein